MQRLLGLVALVVCAAQTPRPHLSATQAQQFEAALRSNPQDRAARSALLNYYFLNSRLDPAKAIPARRRHILWLIENAPGEELAGGPAATIDAAGHYLADAQGFKQASSAWRAQTAKRDISGKALANAAYFFKLSDKEFTIALLERALTLEPTSKEIGARLGDEYALAIMGVTMVNKNGYPLRADPSLIESLLAKQARESLKTSRNPYVLAKAGYMLSWQGSVLYDSRKISFDTAPLAESALQRAASLAPGEADVANYLEQHHAILRQRQGARVAYSELPPSPPARPQVTADDLKKVAAGMNREQLLKIGEPAGRITLSEDGHLIEVFQYSANGASLGTVRLTDGTVSSVQLP